MLRVQTICRLGQDAIVNNVNGKTVINFNAAYSEKYKNPQGEEINNTTWMNCAYWTDKIGLAPYLKKGAQIYMEGKPDVRTYTNKDNQLIPQLAIRVSSIRLLDSREQQAQPQQPQQPPQPNDEYVDDLPF